MQSNYLTPGYPPLIFVKILLSFIGLFVGPLGFADEMADMNNMHHAGSDHTAGKPAMAEQKTTTQIPNAQTTLVSEISASKQSIPINQSIPIAVESHSHTNITNMMEMPTAQPPRSPDYSDGYVNHGEHAMHMGPQWGLAVHQLEFNLTHLSNNDRATYSNVNAEAWYGSQENRAVMRVDSNARNRYIEESAVRLSWRRPWTAFWNGELGVEHDRQQTGNQRWFTASVVGIMPYWIYTEATLKATNNAQSAAEFTVNYNWRITQHVGLQPQLDWIRYFNQKNTAQPRQISRLGLRLFYKISPQFQPYIGYVYHHPLNTVEVLPTKETASDFANQQGVIGVSFWF